MTTKITEQNISNLANVGVSWQSVNTADGSTVISLQAGKGYFIDTTSAVGLVSLPTSPNVGDTIAIKDYAGTFATNALTIQRNGNNIQGAANNSQISTNRANVELVYIDSTKGWLYTNESNVGDLGSPLFITATGGTVTTSGDFKIHSFTGDGCFSISSLGNPTGGPSNVDYLVIAGGGAGGSFGGAGGGAGGYRTTFPSPGCNAGSFPITATAYPITVGSGGAINTSGNPSVFSTITSTAGGKGGVFANGTSGGSGGGGAGVPGGGTGGAGNTPPTSPSQGNNGGNGQLVSCGSWRAGGGGGASAVGVNATPTAAGNGGNGLANSITGSPVTRAGGGAGSAYGPGTQGSGGSGGGGNASGSGVAGTINTGSGGGGGFFCASPASGLGGSGVVVIRYKFQ
jgi:hypothetical protein